MFGKRQQEELLLELGSLRERVAELEADHLRGLRLDSITGVLSASALRGSLADQVETARRAGRPLSLAVIAVDDFTLLELRHGFRAGDDLLRGIATRLGSRARSHDLVGRIGQAEFGLLLPNNEDREVLAPLQRLLVELEMAGEGPIKAAGASIGIAQLGPRMSAEGLLASAKIACEQAQRDGGGRAVLAGAHRSRFGTPQPAPQRDAIEALAVALLERDRYTGEHSKAVIEISAAVAQNLGLGPAEVQRVKSAALLHDIGKVAIPDDILRKPGPLDEQEWKLMRQHPMIGERILRVLPGLGTVARIVRHEHERWDGDGYPDGLARDQIPIGSRIIIAADSYHAITSDRPYRAARSHNEAIEELARGAGSQFDPKVTAALIGHLYGQRRASVLVG